MFSAEHSKTSIFFSHISQSYSIFIFQTNS